MITIDHVLEGGATNRDGTFRDLVAEGEATAERLATESSFAGVLES